VSCSVAKCQSIRILRKIPAAHKTYYSETACVANGRGQLSVSNPLHTSLHHGDYALLDSWHEYPS